MKRAKSLISLMIIRPPRNPLILLHNLTHAHSCAIMVTLAKKLAVGPNLFLLSDSDRKPNYEARRNGAAANEGNETMTSNTHNQILPTLASAGSALLKADDANHSAMQAAACAIMLAVEETKLKLPGAFSWGSYYRDAKSTPEAKEFNKALREAVANSFEKERDAGRDTDLGVTLKARLKKLQDKMLVAAKSAAALRVMGCTTHDYKPFNNKLSAFHVKAANMTPHDENGKPMNGRFASSDAEFPLSNVSRMFIVEVPGKSARVVSVGMDFRTVEKQAAVLTGKTVQKRNAKQAAEDGAKSLAASPIGLASLMSQAGAVLVGEDGGPAKVLRDNAEVNAETASLLVSLMAAYGIMMMHDDTDAAPQFNAKRALAVYEAARDGNSVDLSTH
jgi:hypothetical protein